MKKIIKHILIISLIVAFANGCDDVLQVEEQTAIDGDRVFNDPQLAELYLNSIYGSVLPGFGGTANVGLSDESVGGGDLIYGREPDPTTANGDGTPGDYSRNTYAKIRNINLFIQQVAEGSIDQVSKDSFTGQALFLRAWVYWILVNQYGGVPLVLVPLDNNDDIDDALPRVSAAKCVDQIVADLDQAIGLLGTYGASGYGRIPRSAAAAFKGRVLLFFASPQFDPNGTTSANGIAARWEAAYQANFEAKQIALEEGHGLYPDFSRIFLEEDNEEAIMITKYSVGLKTHTYENSVRPSSVDNSGNPVATPSWDLVQSFPMKSGLPITAAGSGYDEDVYWADRDPRLAATVGYNSIAWKFAGRDDERQWAYINNKQETGIIPQNGFYLKKNINTSITNTQTVSTPTDWIEIRYAEVLLNLAESANEVGRADEAYQELFAIRDRAGIEAGSGNYGLTPGLAKAELRQVILNERKIEMAFENKRFWDLRRRNLYINSPSGVAGAGLNGTKRQRIITRVNTTYIIDNNTGIAAASNPTDSAFKYFEAILIDSVDWDNPSNYPNFFTTTVEDAEDLDMQYLQPKYNFYYLPLNALGLNENLEQTINWVDGTFDPLAEQ
ncbi:MAG: RagB/SusD family nutrient uptake outer membrane protein [Marinoscillum sp.]